MTPEQRQALKTLLTEVLRTYGTGQQMPPDVVAALTRLVQKANERLSQQQQGTQQQDEGVKLLWFLSRGNPEAFVQYLRTIPDPSLKGIGQSPQQLIQTITQLQQQYPKPDQPSMLGELDNAPLQSSQIAGFKYDPKNAKLLVKFQGDGVYAYSGVPQYLFNMFQAGAHSCTTKGRNQYGNWWIGKRPSLGSAFYNFIKQMAFPYQKLA